MSPRSIYPPKPACRREHDLGELFDCIRPYLKRHALRIVRNVADADDLVQTAFIKLLQADRAGGLASTNELVGWLRRSVRNLAIDELRRQRVRRHDPISVDEIESLTPDPLAAWRVVELESFDELRLRDQRNSSLWTVMTLRYEALLSYEEIARQLDVSPNTVASRIHRAKLILKQYLSYQDGRK